jgi:hypothetical protein
MRVLLLLKTFWPMILTTRRAFPWRENKPLRARIPPSTTRCVLQSPAQANAIQPPAQIHNFARVVRAHVPASNVQAWLSWLNSTFSQQGKGALQPSPAPFPSPRHTSDSSAAIALGAESVEVSQQMDDVPAHTRAPKDVELVVVDAVMSFVGHQDYLTAAPQLDALVNVRAQI